jgi:sarcinarray family protein
MKHRILILVLAVLILDFQAVARAENEYGIVRTWFKGENATVADVQLKIGEPVEVKVDILSKIDGHVTLKLKEPGVTTAYDVLSGPSKIDEKISNS